MSNAAKYTLKPTLSKKFRGIIWRIETDEANNTVAVETRIPESREVDFSVFNYAKGEPLLEEIRTENESWWNMDRLHQNTLYLHGYLGKNTPEHKGICAIDIISGIIKWQNFQLTLEDISNEGLVTYNPLLQPRKFLLLDPADGSIISSQLIGYKPLDRNIIFPNIVSNKHLPSFLPQNIAGPVFFIEKNKKMCWSFHTENQGLFTQILLIFEQDRVILKDILAEGIQKLNPEAFFIQKNHLFCIRGNNREIVTYLL